MTGDTAAAPESAYRSAVLALVGESSPLRIQEELLPALQDALAGIPDAALRRPERPGGWSMLEVVQHLVDAELVHGYRVRMVLAQDAPALPGYDQNRWVETLRYNRTSIADALVELRVLRERNLRLLRTLRGEELDRMGIHETRGPESVRTMIALIAGHDLVHRRQIDRIKRALGV